MDVRDAIEVDAPAVSAIGKSVVPDTYRTLCDPAVIHSIVEQSYAPEALARSINRCLGLDTAHFLVAEREGRVVGFLHYDAEGREPELRRIYIELDRKREGIGSALLEELHRRLPDGATYILMAVADNHPAVSFYRRHGLTEQERVDGVAYMHEHMGVDFPVGTPPVPALVLRFTKEVG
jgi:GNAT superfamily N-acetyltransferase